MGIMAEQSSKPHSRRLPHMTLYSHPQFICRLGVEDESYRNSVGVAGHSPRSRRAGTRQGRAVRREGWRGRGPADGETGRPRGGQRVRAAPGRSSIPAQSQELTLRLAGHGAVGPGSETAAGAGNAGAEAFTAAVPRAVRVVLPRALRLRAGWRPALPWPSSRPHQTVSTGRPRSLPFVTRCWAPLLESRTKGWTLVNFSPFPVMRTQS